MAKVGDIFWMERALQLANYAAQRGEVPVGAVVLFNEEIIGEGWNCPIEKNDPTAHAEIMALSNAAKKIGNYRLVNATLYVTLEPCMMCAGAMINARIRQLIFGAYDLKGGVVKSQDCALDKIFLNHRIEYKGGILEKNCGEILSNFFKARRKAQNQ